jgi:hypothetical protein
MSGYVWSYSNLNQFDTCPKQFYHKHVLKEKEPPTEVSEYGNRVHKELEDRLRIKKPLSQELAKYEPYCLSIEQRGDPYVELAVGLRRDGSPTGFFAPDVWGRGKIDVLLVNDKNAWVGDWKTGKKKEDEGQVKIFALFAFHYYPQIETVNCNYIWLKSNEIGKRYQFRREDLPALWKNIMPSIEGVEHAYETGNFPPRPSGLCKGWCPVSSCQYWKRKD